MSKSERRKSPSVQRLSSTLTRDAPLTGAKSLIEVVGLMRDQKHIAIVNKGTNTDNVPVQSKRTLRLSLPCALDCALECPKRQLRIYPVDLLVFRS